MRFSGCTSLTEIVIPDSVTTIEEYAFQKLHELQKLLSPTALTTRALVLHLTEIVIPDSVTTIGDYAFTNGNPNLILKPEGVRETRRLV